MFKTIIKKIRKWLHRNCLELQERTIGKDRWLSTSEKRRIARGVKQFFAQNYELRYNVIKQYEEFREKPTCQNRKPPHGNEEPPQWKQLTDRELKRIAFEQMEQVGVAWSIDVELYVRSAIVRDYNPIEDYLKRCPKWDGTDHIRQLARRVPCNTEHWPNWFHRWFLAMVAQWQQLSRDYGNSIVPLLIGRQGTHKSTFCKLILPPSLREYYIDDIKLDSAEQVERMISRMLLVNIDEYNAKTDREQAKIKRILTERDVQTRKMRSDQYQMLPRMASFIATTNAPEPLCDPTGSRRYLCCELKGIIDTESPINYPQLYAQAIAELQQHVPWYFNKEEEAAIEQHNQMYMQQSTPEQIILAYYEPAPSQKEYFLLAVDIQRELQSHLRTADVPSLQRLTTALRHAHFAYGAVGGRRGWYAKQLAPRGLSAADITTEEHTGQYPPPAGSTSDTAHGKSGGAAGDTPKG